MLNRTVSFHLRHVQQKWCTGNAEPIQPIQLDLAKGSNFIFTHPKEGGSRIQQNPLSVVDKVVTAMVGFIVVGISTPEKFGRKKRKSLTEWIFNSEGAGSQNIDWLIPKICPVATFLNFTLFHCDILFWSGAGHSLSQKSGNFHMNVNIPPYWLGGKCGGAVEKMQKLDTLAVEPGEVKHS